jgi:hypothetical protein
MITEIIRDFWPFSELSSSVPHIYGIVIESASLGLICQSLGGQGIDGTGTRRVFQPPDPFCHHNPLRNIGGDS